MKRLSAAYTAAVVLLLVGAARAGVPDKIANWTIGGSSQSASNIDNTGRFDWPHGLQVVHETFIPPTLSSFSVVNVRVTTTVFVNNGGSTTVTSLTDSRVAQPAFPMVLTFAAYLDTVTFQNVAYGGQSTVTVKGIDSMGYRRTEQILVGTFPVVSNYAYQYISSMTWGTSPLFASTETAFLFLNVGSTNSIGLSNDISTGGYHIHPQVLYTTSRTATLGTNYTPEANLGFYGGTGSKFPQVLGNSGISGIGYVNNISSTPTPVMKITENSVYLASCTVDANFSTVRMTSNPNNSTRWDIWYVLTRSRKPIY